MMENPGKVLCAKRTISIIMGLVQVILAIISFATFQSAQGNVKGMISTWNLVRTRRTIPLPPLHLGPGL